MEVILCKYGIYFTPNNVFIVLGEKVGLDSISTFLKYDPSECYFWTMVQPLKNYHFK